MESREIRHTGERTRRSEQAMHTSDGTPFVDLDVLKKIRNEIAEAKIPGLDSVEALVGEDVLMWQKFKKGETINKKEFQNYYNRVEKDKMSEIFGLSRYNFAKYIFYNPNTKFK